MIVDMIVGMIIFTIALKQPGLKVIQHIQHFVKHVSQKDQPLVIKNLATTLAHKNQVSHLLNFSLPPSKPLMVPHPGATTVSTP